MTSTDIRPLPVYIHINKNGGTSVRQLLQANLARQRIFDTVVPRRWGLDGRPRSVHSQDGVVQGELAELWRRQWKLDCFASNLPFGIHEVIVRPCEYFAAVREPLDRVLSLWSDTYRARSTSQLWRSWEENDFDLARIVVGPSGIALCNDQTRMLTGLRQRKINLEHVSEAVANLETRFSVVGCFEEMPAFADRLCRHYRWSKASIKHLNAGSREGIEMLSKTDLELLRASNEYDLQLYEEIRHRWGRLQRSAMV